MFTLSYDHDFSLPGNSSPPSPCVEPLTYRFGDIDSRFNITKKQLADIMKEVETLWTTAMDRELLKYQENGRVVIKLIYSKEQKRMEDERAFSKRISVKKQQIEVMKREYKRLEKRFKERQADFKSTLADYNNLVKSYNNEISEYQKQGGISREQKDRLKETKRKISRLKREVNRKQKNLELLRKRTNAKSRQLNSLVEQQNKMIAKYNKRFGEPRKFDQGRYIRQGQNKQINIYQFANDAQLKTVLAHETGHAMGLGHVDNPKSIMHAMMDKQNIFNLTLTKEDISAIKEKCEN